jgi:hypothetical protein
MAENRQAYITGVEAGKKPADLDYSVSPEDSPLQLQSRFNSLPVHNKAT